MSSNSTSKESRLTGWRDYSPDYTSLRKELRLHSFAGWARVNTANQAPSLKVVVHKTTTLQPGAQNSVLVTTEATGLVIIEPRQQLFSKQTCLIATGVHQVKSEIPSRILIANFDTSHIRLRRGHNVAKVDEHPTNLVESDVSHVELLGIVSEDTHYKKRDINI